MAGNVLNIIVCCTGTMCSPTTRWCATCPRKQTRSTWSWLQLSTRTWSPWFRKKGSWEREWKKRWDCPQFLVNTHVQIVMSLCNIKRLSKQTSAQCSALLEFAFNTFVVVSTFKGVLHFKKATYDHLQDDERQCAKCRTTCYLSAITCPCNPGVLVCLHHITDLCSCPISQYTLK